MKINFSITTQNFTFFLITLTYFFKNIDLSIIFLLSIVFLAFLLVFEAISDLQSDLEDDVLLDGDLLVLNSLSN